MKTGLFYLFLLFLLLFNTVQASENKNYLSFSLGQFDINDSKDSVEYRIEYLSGDTSSLLPSNLSLKPLYGIMVNRDDGMYIYSGLRKDINVRDSIFFTPSFAMGYYDQENSKDLGYDLEFRTQLELSYQFENMNRVALSLNHISNASLGEENPGVESMVISFIRVF